MTEKQLIIKPPSRLYLAIPYTGVEEKSNWLATLVCAYFTWQGYNAFSPITHSHPMAKKFGLPGNWEFWEKIDKQYIDDNDAVIVINPIFSPEPEVLLQNSKGVQAEVEYAKATGKPVELFTPNLYKDALFKKLLSGPKPTIA